MSDINETYPALDSLASKLGLILSRIQETIFKDFLNGLDENGETWDDFKNSHGDPNFDIVKKYVNSIIKKIGYDISGFSKDSEVFKLFVSIIDTSNSVADTLGKIFKENGSGDEPIGDGTFAKDESFSEFFSLSGESSGLKFGNNSFGGSVEFDNSQPLLRLKAIYDSVQKLLQLFKYLSEIEWKNIAGSNDEFYKFVKKNNFSEKFAKRLVDYVLITFIKTAREVFENDIERIIELNDENSLSKLKSYSSLDDVEFNNALDNVREYKRQIDTINELITSSNANVFSKEQLEIFKNVLRQRIDEVLDGIAPEYNATAKVLNRVYAVFEFLGFIGYDKVDLAQFTANATASIEVKIPVFRWDLVEKAFADLEEERKKYFDIAFPMENKEELENLISRISNLARSFQKDIPQFDTVKHVLWNLIARVNLLIDGTIGIVDEEINKLITLKKFLLDLLKTNEFVSIQTKNSLTNFFEDYKNSAEGWFSKLYNGIKEEFDENNKQEFLDIIDENTKNVDFKNSVIESFTETFFEKIIDYCRNPKNESVLESVKAQIIGSSNDIWNETKRFISDINLKLSSFFYGDDWKDQFSDVLNQVETDFLERTKNVSQNIRVSGLQNFSINEFDGLWGDGNVKNPFSDFDPNAYFQILVDGIAKFPKLEISAYFDDFKSFVENSIKSIIDQKLKPNCAENFDFTKESALVDAILKSWWKKSQSRFVELVAKPYIDKIKSAACEWSEKVLNIILRVVKILINGEDQTADVNVSVSRKNIRKDSRNKAGNSIPDEDEIEAEIKKAVKSAVAPVESTVESALDSLKKELNSAFGIEQYIDDFIKDNELDDKIDVIKGIIKLCDSKGPDYWATWENAIDLILKVYNLFPPSVRKYFANQFVKPDFSKYEKQLRKYKKYFKCSFDAKNKILLVTFNIKDKSVSTGAVGDAGVVLQLLIFIAQDKEKNDCLFIMPIFKAGLNVKLNIGSYHYIELSAGANLNTQSLSADTADGTDKIKEMLTKENLGILIKKKDRISKTQFLRLSDENNSDEIQDFAFVYFKGLIERGRVSSNDGGEGAESKKSGTKKSGKKDVGNKDAQTRNAEKITLLDTDIATLEMDANYPQTLLAEFGCESGFDAGYHGSLSGLDLCLKLKEQNDFFNTILKKDIEISLDKLEIGYTLKKGFSVNNLDNRVRIPINIDSDFNVVKFKNIALDLGIDGKDILAELFTSFSVDFGGINISFNELGVGVDLKLPTLGNKNFDVLSGISYPKGLGISIDVDFVKGGGAILWDKGRQRFSGAIELTIMNKVSAEAVTVFSTGYGADPFSFMGALCVYYNPGAQLGMGFSLEGIGGSFGLNRMLSTDNLRKAVNNGTLESALFYQDISKNADRVLANVERFYPVKKGQLYFGFLGKVAWGSILKADFGLFIQAPKPVTILVAGVVKVSVPGKLLALNACFIGGVQFDKGIFVDASIYDSHIVGLQMHGDMALRIFWGGETKGFILSVGGFHPEYTPETGFKLPAQKRVGLSLKHGIIKFSLEAYFAITSNTVQFGTKVGVHIGWKKFGMTGGAAFNALFQFNPFKFVVDMSAHLAVKIGSKKVCSVSLSFELSGPAPWHTKGYVSFKILFVRFKCRFDYTWGKNQVENNRRYINILPLFTKEFSQKSNWKAISSDWSDNLVSIVKLDNLVLLPSDGISFCQSAVPLKGVNDFDRIIECYGEDEINDFKQLAIDSVFIGNAKQTVKNEKSSFAPSLIKKLSEKEKLKAKSYESMVGGFKLSDVSSENRVPRAQYEKSFENHMAQPINNSIKEIWARESAKAAADGTLNNAQKTKSEKVPDMPRKTMPQKTELVLDSVRYRNGIRTDIKIDSDKHLDFLDLYKLSEDDEKYLDRQYRKITSGSCRRSASGFNRFVKQWDEFMCSETGKITATEND